MISFLSLLLGTLASGSAEPAWALRYIDLRISVDSAAPQLAGAADVQVMRTSASSPLALELSDSLVVDSAWAESDGARTHIVGSRERGSIVFDLGQSSASI